MGLIGLPSRPSTQNQLCGCLTTKIHRRPCLLGPIDWKDVSGCLDPSNSLTLNPLGPSTLVYPHTTHLSSCKCNAWVYMYKEVGTHWVRSTRLFRKQLTRVGISHTRLNSNVSDSPYSPSSSCLHVLFHFNTATLCNSQGLGLVDALTATIEGENCSNTNHRTLAYTEAKLKIEIRCIWPLGIIALVSG